MFKTNDQTDVASPPPSIITIDSLRASRPLRIVGIHDYESDRKSFNEKKSHIDVAVKLHLTSYIVSSILFICQIVIASCLCKPAIVLAGLWVALLFLGHGFLGNRAVHLYTHTLLLSHTWLSLFVGIVGLVAAGYIFSGHLVVLCVSSFHQPDHASVVRLYVVEVVSLLASAPCLIGVVSCIISASLSYKAAQRPQKSQFVVCVQDQPSHEQQSNWKTAPPQGGQANPTALNRPTTPPPSYCGPVKEESFA